MKSKNWPAGLVTGKYWCMAVLCRKNARTVRFGVGGMWLLPSDMLKNDARQYRLPQSPQLRQARTR